MKLLWTIALFTFGFFGCSDAFGQDGNLRYELGKRVKQYELLWESSSPESRALSTGAMERAVQEFFRLDLAGAAKSLDDAWFAMLIAPSELKRYAASMSLSSASILVDAIEPSLRLTLQELYPQPLHAWAQNVFVEIDLRTAHPIGAARSQRKRVPIQSLPIEIEWKLEGIEPGDFQLSATIHKDEMIGSVVGPQVSIMNDKQARIQAIEAWVDENKRAARTSTLCTARMMGRQLILADRPKPFECDLPFSSWFQEFESMAYATPAARPSHPSGRSTSDRSSFPIARSDHRCGSDRWRRQRSQNRRIFKNPILCFRWRKGLWPRRRKTTQR